VVDSNSPHKLGDKFPEASGQPIAVIYAGADKEVVWLNAVLKPIEKPAEKPVEKK